MTVTPAITARKMAVATLAMAIRIVSASRSYPRHAPTAGRGDFRHAAGRLLFSGHTMHTENIPYTRRESNPNNRNIRCHGDRARCADVPDGTPRASLCRRGAILG